MGSLTFRFKKPINYAYAPGLTKAGKDGTEGNPGADGNALYFIDYELNNSYIIELTQQKLENNYVLSGESEQISDRRGYHSGDIIVSNSGNCYRIVEGTDPYYTYGIEYIGRISGKEIEEEPKEVVKVLAYEFDTSAYPHAHVGYMPSNRQFLTRDNNTISVNPDYTTESDVYDLDDAFTLNGLWYKFLVVTDSSFGENTDFTVEVMLNNSKTYQADSVSMIPNEEYMDPTAQPLYRMMNFYKNMEFKAPSIEETEELSFEDVADYGEIRPVFISDMSLDKMHLFGNDIKAPNFKVDNDMYCSRDGVSELHKVTDLEAQTIMQTRKIPVGTSEWIYAIYSTFLPEYYMSTEEDMINWRGGESAFFSSCNDIGIMQKIMREFISSANIRVLAHNRLTDEVKVFENIPVINIRIDEQDNGEDPETDQGIQIERT